MSNVSSAQALEEIRKEGKRRLYPSLANPNWLVLRKRRQVFANWLKRLNQKDLVVLDVGGRIQPYRPLVADVASRYISVDLGVTPLVDVVGDAARLPVRDACVNIVLCTQVLEYVPEPKQVIAEIHRVLRPTGFVLLSAPAVFPQDSEREYWRFLPRALTELFKDFASVDLVAEGSTLTGIFRTFNVCLASFAPGRGLRKLLCFTIVPAINLAGAALEALKITRDTRFTANFSIMAQK
ncbi:MAG: methyltransferase domain-containing protein [Terriglobales bacterium]